MGNDFREMKLAIIEAMNEARQGGKGGGLPNAGQSSQVVTLLVKNRQTGLMMPLEFDAETLGLKLAGSFSISSIPNLVVSSLPTVNTLGDGGVRKLVGKLLGNADTQIYAATEHWKDVSMVISLVDTVAQTFRLYHGAVGDANAIWSHDCQLIPGQAPYFVNGLGLRNGEEFRGYCSTANKVCVAVYGAPRAAGT